MTTPPPTAHWPAGEARRERGGVVAAAVMVECCFLDPNAPRLRLKSGASSTAFMRQNAQTLSITGTTVTTMLSDHKKATTVSSHRIIGHPPPPIDSLTVQPEVVGAGGGVQNGRRDQPLVQHSYLHIYAHPCSHMHAQK